MAWKPPAGFDRFVKYWNGDEEKARSMYEDLEAWRTEFAVDKITIADVHDLISKDIVTLVGTSDKHGRPISLINWRNFHPDQMDEVSLSRCIAYLFDQVYRMNPPVSEMFCLFDYSDWSLRQTAPRLAKLSLDIAKRYPFVPISRAVNVPWYFRVIWKVVSPWMTKSALEHWKVLGSPKDLQDEVEKQFVPKHLGGSYEYDIEEWIKKRYQIEGLKEGQKGSGEDAFALAMQRLDTPIDEIADNCTYQGYLAKKGSGGYFGTTSWKDRLFILRGHELYYFTDSNADKANKVFDLRYCSVRLPEEDEETEKPNTFFLVTAGRHMPLAAADEETLNEWVEALKSATGK
eukprot:Colp12_sorted_trinity150504_noHs@10258